MCAVWEGARFSRARAILRSVCAEWPAGPARRPSGAHVTRRVSFRARHSPFPSIKLSAIAGLADEQWVGESFADYG
jgi:hypothetical protein